mgnify:CR=1 FL=1|tara:strand:+ start:287 stop:760 length:474 start_codon:yes stop_codon:yes gene_type:complete
MNKSELKQLIQEELKNALSEKKYVIWKGSRVEVVKDEGGPTITVKKPNGREGEVFRKDTISPPLNESPQPLVPQKDIIANAIENNNIPNEEFTPQSDKGVIVNFIRNGNPSEEYLGKMMSILKKNGIKVNFPQLTPLPDRSIEDIEDFNAILSKYLK